MFLIKVFWKMYFAFIVIFCIHLNYPFQFQDFIEWVDFLMMIPSLVGLYGLAFQKQMLNPLIWKLYFCILLSWDFYYHFVIETFYVHRELSAEFIVVLILLIPLYIGLWSYAFFQLKDN